MRLVDYIGHLRTLTVAPKSSQASDEQSRWFARVAAFKKRQRAYGLVDNLKNWVMRHGYKRQGDALPN